MLYVAYGSNTPEQMEDRCPSAVYLGKRVLNDYRLVFRHYLTIEVAFGEKVEVMLYEVPDKDMRHLDLYEGFPSLYRKEFVSIGEEEEAVVYIMNEEQVPYMLPTTEYLLGVLSGYRDCEIPLSQITEAMTKTINYMNMEL